jgi:hypothetical protein
MSRITVTQKPKMIFSDFCFRIARFFIHDDFCRRLLSEMDSISLSTPHFSVQIIAKTAIAKLTLSYDGIPFLNGHIEGSRLFWQKEDKTKPYFSVVEIVKDVVSILCGLRIKRCFNFIRKLYEFVGPLSPDGRSFSIYLPKSHPIFASLHSAPPPSPSPSRLNTSPYFSLSQFSAFHRLPVTLYAACSSRTTDLALFISSDDISDGTKRWSSLNGSTDFEKLAFLVHS